MVYIALDDTDTLESRGTGYLAREIAAALAANHTLLGVTRHQLLRDPRVPCTKNNSSAAILLEAAEGLVLDALLARAQALMLADFQPGSDPGLCVAAHVPAAITAFGRRVQSEIVTQAEARTLAAEHGIRLIGLGGDQGGVIGALAGLQPIPTLLAAGIAAVQTADGQRVSDGMVQTDKLRPARRGGQPIAVVEWTGEYWQPLKLD
jgi:tRNA(Ile2) C34 agmatinyltransferase TiaS